MRLICVQCNAPWKFENKRNKKQHQNKLKKIFKYSENKGEKGETWRNCKMEFHAILIQYVGNSFTTIFSLV